MTTTKTFNLTELRARFELKGIRTLTNGKHEITLDNNHDISLIQLLVHDGSEYFSFINTAIGLNQSYWVTDDEHYVTISSSDDENTEDATTEDATTEDATTEDATTEDATTNETTDIDAIADLCADLCADQILKLIGKLSKIAVKNESKKTTKKNKPEKTQTTQATSNKRVSDKNFNYFTLLCNWYNSALSAREIASDSELSNGYGAATIAEDMRVIKVLLSGDKISKEWADYIINYWSENSDTTWQRLHYAFAKEGRKCNDLDILCNYVIDNGVTKDDVKNAIASQN